MKKKLFFMLVATTVMILGSSMTVLAYGLKDTSNNQGANFTLPDTSENMPTETLYVSISPTPNAQGANNQQASASLTPSVLPETKKITVQVPTAVDTHVHDFRWKTVTEPTDGKDGLSQYMCGCGEVADSQPIAAGHAYVEGIFDQIENAPENSTVVVLPGEYRCYTAKVMEMLKSVLTLS